MKNFIWKFIFFFLIVSGISLETFSQSRILRYDPEDTNKTKVMTEAVCPGTDILFTVDVDPVNKDAATSYLWDFGDGSTATTKEASHAYQDGNRFYDVKVTITFDNGAPDETTDIVSVQVYKRPSGGYDFYSVEAACSGGSIVLSANPQGNHVWWSTGETGSQISITESDMESWHGTDPILIPDAEGKYKVRARIYDDNGCTVMDGAGNVPAGEVEVIFYDRPTIMDVGSLTYNMTEDKNNEGLKVALQIAGDNQDGVTYNWLPDYTVEEVTSNEFALRPKERTVYNVTATQTHRINPNDANDIRTIDCQESRKITVDVEVIRGNSRTPFTANNVFVPNSVNNSQWRMAADNEIGWYKGMELIVYNVWGQEVYSIPALEEGMSDIWDGTTNDGKEVPADTYYYIVRSEQDNITHTGHVTIIRK